MSVRVREIKPPRPPIDWPVLLGKVGAVVALTSFGTVFWAINGGYSVRGLEAVARYFNEGGTLIWYAMASFAIPVPFKGPGVPPSLPIIPWAGVAAASLLQICALWLTLKGRPVPRWMIIATLLLSFYDLGTTFFGLGSVEWIAKAHWSIHITLTVLMTFSVEFIVGLTAKALTEPPKEE